MHFLFSSNNPPPSASIEHVQDDHITLSVCLDDAWTHSGDVFKASFELVGPKKYAGNVKLDYVVVYLYGVYILNQEVITACTNGPLSHNQENINLPFYGVNEKEEQKFLLFYSNPIVLCTDVNFEVPSETTQYHLSCTLPPFLPPTYNGTVIKFKYCMYVEAVKRLYMNRTQFVTKRYEHHLPLRLLGGRGVHSPVIDLVLLPIKPNSSQGEDRNATEQDGEDVSEYLYHDFRVEVHEGGVTQRDNAPARSSRKKDHTPHRGILERGSPFNAPFIPPHLYNRVGKTPLDRLLCLYLLCSLRKEDSSLFLLNHVLPNYNYFHYMHIFLYIAHHCDYYMGELSLSGDAHRMGSLGAFFSLLRSCGGYPPLEEPSGENTTHSGGKTNVLRDVSCCPPHLCLQNDDNHMHDAYLMNYPNFVFNQIKYVPIHWYDNLILHQQSNSPNEATDEEAFANLYLGDTTSESSSGLEEPAPTSEGVDARASSREMLSQTMEDAPHEGGRVSTNLPEQRKEFLLDKAYTTIHTIVKCMQDGDMFRRINTRKIKPHRLSPHLVSGTTDKGGGGVVVSPAKDNSNGPTQNKDASQNIYRINSGRKNICLITLMDGMNNQVTNTFPCGSIITVRLCFGGGPVSTVHVDIRLKRVERVKINPNLLTAQRNRVLGENEMADEGNTSVDSEGVCHRSICSYKLISERNVSTLHCSIKNVSFVLGEDVVPSFSNDTLRVDYLLDFDFFCRSKGEAAATGDTNGGEATRGETNGGHKINEPNEEKGSIQLGAKTEANAAEAQGGTHSDSLGLNECLDDNMYSRTCRIPIHITGRAHDVCPYDTSINGTPAWHDTVNTSEGGNTRQLLLQNSHKFVYADVRHFVRTLKM
ncbi:hypothetical protein AK88_02480 [Plasmodium fragile]|uniref:Uncharacterized protein n=1 Tax=Plasmodium fragile TaxID=5857 RepID=A0A0D9QQA7_PLAFR|nr:uncharacterized protein AK88_02480 [Plasmodium fragile]KJP87876.1 hypothetical protein AK88_02480 [Plasmodium fragile]